MQDRADVTVILEHAERAGSGFGTLSLRGACRLICRSCYAVDPNTTACAEQQDHGDGAKAGTVHEAICSLSDGLVDPARARAAGPASSAREMLWSESTTRQ
jgi:hypothetical protein